MSVLAGLEAALAGTAAGGPAPGGISRWLVPGKRYERIHPRVVPGVKATPLAGPERVLLERPGSTAFAVLDPHQYRLVQAMDGKRSLLELFYLDMEHRERMVLDEVVHLVDRLADRGFLEGIVPGVGHRLEEAMAAGRRRGRSRAWLRGRLLHRIGWAGLEALESVGPLAAWLSGPRALALLGTLTALGPWLASLPGSAVPVDPIGWTFGEALGSDWTTYPKGILGLLVSVWLVIQVKVFATGASLEGLPEHVPRHELLLAGRVPSLATGVRARACATADSRFRSDLLSFLLPGGLGALLHLGAALYAGTVADPASSLPVTLLGKLAWAGSLVMFAEVCPFLGLAGSRLARALVGEDRPVWKSLVYLVRRLPGRLLRGGTQQALEARYLAVGSGVLVWLILFFIRGADLVVSSLIPLLLDILMADSMVVRVFLGGVLASLAVPFFLSFTGIVLFGAWRTLRRLMDSRRLRTPWGFALAGVLLPLSGIGLLVLVGVATRPGWVATVLLLATWVVGAVLGPLASLRLAHECRGSRLRSAFRYLTFEFLSAACALPLVLDRLGVLHLDPDASGLDRFCLKLFFGFDALSFVFLFPFFLYLFHERLGQGLALAAFGGSLIVTGLAGDGATVFLQGAGVRSLAGTTHGLLALLAFLGLVAFARSRLAGFWFLLGSFLVMRCLSQVVPIAGGDLIDPGVLALFVVGLGAGSSLIGLMTVEAHRLAFARIEAAPRVTSETNDERPERSLVEGAIRLFNGLAHVMASHFGEGRAARLKDLLRDGLEPLRLPVKQVRGRLHFDEEREMPDPDELRDELVDLAARYVGAVEHLAGRTFLERALEVCANELTWEESELLAVLVLRHVPGYPAGRLPARPLGRDDRLSFLARIPLFYCLEEQELVTLLHCLRRVTVPAGKTILRQGDPGREFFVVLEGSLRVVMTDLAGVEVPVARLSADDAFGETALLQNIPRTATVVSMTDVTLLVLESDDFREIVARTSETRARIGALIRHGGFLSRVGLFADLPGGRLLSLAHRLREQRFAPGMDVIREGEEGDDFFLIREGRAEVVRAGEKVSELGTGDSFGEIALLTHQPRTATVRTLTDCVLLSIGKEDFYVEFAGYMSTMKNLGELAEQRLHHLRGRPET